MVEYFIHWFRVIASRFATASTDLSSNEYFSTAEPPAAVVGCLLDVSNSMRYVLETSTEGGMAVNRLRAVLRAALKLARAEQRHKLDAFMFISACGVQERVRRTAWWLIMTDLLTRFLHALQI